MKTKIRGGKRKNAGRKPIDPDKKKQQIYIFVETQYINKIGLDRAKHVAESAIIEDANIKDF